MIIKEIKIKNLLMFMAIVWYKIMMRYSRLYSLDNYLIINNEFPIIIIDCALNSNNVFRSIIKTLYLTWLFVQGKSR